MSRVVEWGVEWDEDDSVTVYDTKAEALLAARLVAGGHLVRIITTIERV